jgi:hypothetical protein
MAKKIEIEVDVTGNVVESEKNLRALKKQLKELPAGTEGWNKVFNQIDDLEDKLKSAKNTGSDWIDSLEQAGGPLGMLGTGLNKLKVATQSFGAALKATGIGLVVSLIGMLVAAFSQTEGSMKKLEPLMIMLEKLFGGLVEAFMPLVESFADIAIKVLPVFITGIKNVYGGLVSFFTLIKEAGTGVGKILKGIFTFDTKSVDEGYNQLKGSWDKTKEAFNEFTNNFDKGYAKQTKTQKENSKNSKEDADKALADRLKNMETNDKLDQSELEKQKQLALAEAFNDEQRLFVEEKFYQKSYELRKKDLLDKQKLYKVGTNEYKELQTQLNTLDAERIGKVKEFKDKDKEIRDKNSKEIVDFEIQLAKDLQKIEEDKQKDKIEALQSQLALDESRLKSLTENTLAYFEQQRVIENDNYILQLEKFKGNKKELERVEQEHSNVIKAIDKTTKEYKQNQLLATLDMYAQFGSGLQQLAGKNKALAKTGLLIEKGAGIASIVINTQKKAADAGYFSPLGIATLIAGAAGVATSIAASIKGIREIDSAGSGDSGGGNPSLSEKVNYGDGGMIEGPRHAGGGVMINAEGGEAVMTRGAVTMFNPLLSMMNQMGGGVSFSKGATGQASYDSPRTTQIMSQPQIIKTYVVSSEMTNDQHRQERLKDLSTL